MKNPTQLTMVNAVPFVSAVVVLATNVENSGESVITATPQRSKKTIITVNEAPLITSGESKQHNPEVARAIAAMYFVLNFSERYPPAIHPMLPMPIIIKE